MFNFAHRLETGLAGLGIDLTVEAIARLELYFTELKKWARKINLIARSTSDEQIVENHFLDSLTIMPLLDGLQGHLLDIGTGAGFPALVCKVACPELTVTLVEPRLKRVSFLGHMVRSLGLQQVKLLSCRVEDQVQLPSSLEFSHITARAVTDIGSFLRMAERFSSSSPRLICMKGPKWQEELKEAEQILACSAYSLEKVVQRFLPFSGAERNIVLLSVQQDK